MLHGYSGFIDKVFCDELLRWSPTDVVQQRMIFTVDLCFVCYFSLAQRLKDSVDVALAILD